MSSFSVLGGVLSIMSSSEDEATAVTLLSQSKQPAELVILAKTAASLHANALFRAICLAIFKGRTPEQVRESFAADDDLAPGDSSGAAANEGSAAVTDLTVTLSAAAVLPLLPWADLDVCSQVCRRCRDWAAPEMERRVVAAMAGDDSVVGGDPTFAVGSVRELARAQERIAGVRRRDAAAAAPDGAPGTRVVDLSGVKLGGAGWAGIIGAITGAPELCEVNLSGCLIPKATCYDLMARFFEQCPALQHVETERAGDDGDAEGWVFSVWRLHVNELDRSVEVVHARSELFLLNVHLDGNEWERILEKMVGSPCLERLILTMCHIPHSCATTLSRVLTSCPHLSMGPLGGAYVDTSWAGDDKLEFGWVDTMWHQVSGGECHGDGIVLPPPPISPTKAAAAGAGAGAGVSVVPKAALQQAPAAAAAATAAADQSLAELSLDEPLMQIRSRRLEMEGAGGGGGGGGRGSRR